MLFLLYFLLVVHRHRRPLCSFLGRTHRSFPFSIDHELSPPRQSLLPFWSPSLTLTKTRKHLGPSKALPSRGYCYCAIVSLYFFSSHLAHPFFTCTSPHLFLFHSLPLSIIPHPFLFPRSPTQLLSLGLDDLHLRKSLSLSHLHSFLPRLAFLLFCIFVLLYYIKSTILHNRILSLCLFTNWLFVTIGINHRRHCFLPCVSRSSSSLYSLSLLSHLPVAVVTCHSTHIAMFLFGLSHLAQDCPNIRRFCFDPFSVASSPFVCLLASYPLLHITFHFY